MQDRHLTLARPLVDAGVQFATTHYQADDPAILALVRETIPGSEGFAPSEPMPGLIAAELDDEIIGVAIIAAMKAGPELNAYIWQLAVREDWQGRGVGTVLLGMIPQRLEEHGQVALTFGGTRPENADFFQKAGFDVHEPGAVVTINGRLVTAPEATVNPCWITRRW